MAYAEQQQIVERYGAETLLLLAPRPDDAQAVDETRGRPRAVRRRQ